MPQDKTVVMEWHYTTPCGRCGRDIRITKDASGGEKKFSESATVRVSCTKCGHEDTYPASAVDNKLLG